MTRSTVRDDAVQILKENHWQKGKNAMKKMENSNRPTRIIIVSVCVSFLSIEGGIYSTFHYLLQLDGGHWATHFQGP